MFIQSVGSYFCYNSIVFHPILCIFHFFQIAIGIDLGGCVFGVTLASNFMSYSPLRHSTPVYKSAYLLKMLLHCIIYTRLIGLAWRCFILLWYPACSGDLRLFQMSLYAFICGDLRLGLLALVFSTLGLYTCCAHLLVTHLNVSMFVMWDEDYDTVCTYIYVVYGCFPIDYQFLLPRWCACISIPWVSHFLDHSNIHAIVTSVLIFVVIIFIRQTIISNMMNMSFFVPRNSCIMIYFITFSALFSISLLCRASTVFLLLTAMLCSRQLAHGQGHTTM